MEDDPDSAAERARRRWRDQATRASSPPWAEPSNVGDPEAALARRAETHGLHMHPIRNPQLLAFLGAVARAEAMGLAIEDVPVMDRSDFAQLVAVARERGYLDPAGRLTAAARDYADDQLAPLLPLLLRCPGGGG